MDSPSSLALTVGPVAAPDARGATRVTLRGELDAAWMDRIDALVLRLVTCGDPVVLDLEHVTFIDCCGLSGLIEVVDIVRQCGIEIALGESSEPVELLLHLTGCRPFFAGR